MELEPSLSAMVGSCNGLVCCLVKGKSSLERDAIYICNPVIEEYVYLPTLTYNKACNGYFYYGFGYHHSTDEYKVVRIYYGEVEVYTLGSGQGWRHKGRTEHRLDYISGVCANGYLHWIQYRKNEIVAFHLADEEFRLIPFPPISKIRSYKVVYLQLMFGGYLCAVHMDVGEEDIIVNVWALGKKKKFNRSYDTGEHAFNDFWGWNKKFSIPCAKEE
ncbi:F-box protein At3g07870-like [Papaver somniferum]|uniref:F-box protein At3g07870-like n=1 Tax=Papaver somniferum TaxID=3469 RepID=UPI000E6FCFDD|nr:F-box protein At3g07870-like [Papaver somniferum]